MTLKRSIAKTLLFAAAGIVLGNAALAADYPKINLRLAHFLPSSTANAEWEQWWADEVEKRSGGNVTVKIFWAGSMGGPKEILSLTGSGAVQLGATAQGYFGSEMPIASAGSFFRMHNNPSDVVDTWRKWQEDPAVKADLAKAGVINLYHQGGDPYRLFCTKPVKSTADLKGLRVRTVGAPYWADYFIKLGIVPVTVPFSEMYGALQKGTVDCAFSAHGQAINGKFYEVAKYAIDLSFGAHPIWGIFVNADYYNGLPENVRQLLRDVSDDLMDEQPRISEAKSREIVDTKFPELGVTYVHFENPGKVDELAGSMIDTWMEDMATKGRTDVTDRLAPILRDKQATFSD